METPLRNASVNTTTTGRISINAMKTSARPIRSARIIARSVVTGGGDKPFRLRSNMPEPAPAPGLGQIDGKQHEKGNRQHDDRNRGCARIVEFFELDNDEDRRNLRDKGQIAGDEDHRP